MLVSAGTTNGAMNWQNVPGSNTPVYYEATLQNGRLKTFSIDSATATDAGRTATTHLGIPGTPSAGSAGSDQLFNITVDTNGTATVTLVNSGKNFTVSDSITFSSQLLGGNTDLVLILHPVTDLKIQCSSQPGFVDLTSWHVPSNSNLVSHSTLFAFNNSKRVFQAPRDGRYLVHMRTALKETTTTERTLQMTQRLYKTIALVSDSVYDDQVHASIPTATYSLDFRKVQSVSTNAAGNIQFPTFSNPANTQASDNPNNTEVQIVKDSSGTFPTFSSTDGYPGSQDHFIRMGVLNANPPTQVTMASGSTADFSLEFYAKGFSNASYLLSVALPSNNNSGNNVLFNLFISNSNLTINATNSSNNYVTAFTQNVDVSVFAHIIFTYTAGSLKLYVNNTAYSPVSFTLNTATPAEARLGRSVGGTDSGPESLRFFRFYKSQLSAAQVSTLYLAHVQNEAREDITTYRANKAALYGSVGASSGSFMTSSTYQTMGATFQFDKLVYLAANDVLAIDQQTHNRNTNLADNALEFIPDETALIVRSVD